MGEWRGASADDDAGGEATAVTIRMAAVVRDVLYEVELVVA